MNLLHHQFIEVKGKMECKVCGNQLPVAVLTVPNKEDKVNVTEEVIAEMDLPMIIGGEQQSSLAYYHPAGNRPFFGENKIATNDTVSEETSISIPLIEQNTEPHLQLEEIILNVLSAGLKSSKSSQEFFNYLAKFNLINKQYHQACNSPGGRAIIVDALMHLNVKDGEIDRQVVQCFKSKNFPMFNVLLSLPNADISLLVSKEKTTFRPSLFDKTLHGVCLGVEQDKRLLPLLHLAIKEWPEAVSLLLELGADVDGKDYYTAEADKYYGRSIISNYYEYSSGGMTPLHAACILKNTAVVKLLIEKGADVHGTDESGRTPLHMAALYNNPEAIELLIKHGANPECFFIPTFYIKKMAVHREQNTPLILAMFCGNSEAVSALVNHGCSLKYETQPLLQQAIATRQISIIEKLDENEPGMLDKHIEVVCDALVCSGNISDTLDDLSTYSGFNGLQGTYDHDYKDYLQAINNDEFFPKLMVLIKDQYFLRRVKVIELKFALGKPTCDNFINLLGLKSCNFDENFFTHQEWMMILSKDGKFNDLLHCLALRWFCKRSEHNSDDAPLLFSFLVKKAEEISFDFSVKNDLGETISVVFARYCKNVPADLVMDVSELELVSKRKNDQAKALELELRLASQRNNVYSNALERLKSIFHVGTAGLIEMDKHCQILRSEEKSAEVIFKKMQEISKGRLDKFFSSFFRDPKVELLYNAIIHFDPEYGVSIENFNREIQLFENSQNSK